MGNCLIHRLHNIDWKPVFINSKAGDNELLCYAGGVLTFSNPKSPQIIDNEIKVTFGTSADNLQIMSLADLEVQMWFTNAYREYSSTALTYTKKKVHNGDIIDGPKNVGTWILLYRVL